MTSAALVIEAFDTKKPVLYQRSMTITIDGQTLYPLPTIDDSPG
ncbi:MAG: hypothetical protein VYB37_03635 [Pseudomonadota bacterium]|jgi:hypothetical protein|nr:hypothetical protein [Pseudomonadota bacterium]